MRTVDRTAVCVLRRRGLSLAQISERFCISKSTASLLTRGIELSEFGKARLLNYVNYKRDLKNQDLRNKKNNLIEVKAVEMLRNISSFGNHEVILAMIYLCEGSKDGRSIRFTNSDPNLIRLFLFSFRRTFVINEDRIKVRLHLHDYHDDLEMKNYWSNEIGLPLSFFQRSHIKKSEHKFKKEGYKGCLHVCYHDAYTAKLLLAFARKLIKQYI